MPATTFDSAPIRTAIKTKLEGVANMGKVHPYRRWLKEAAKLITLFKASTQGGDRIYGWEVQKRSERERFLSIGRAIVDIDWQLTSYMGLDDADTTEIKLDAQFELVKDAFRNDDTIGGVVDTLIIDDGGIPRRGVQLELMDEVMFAGVLCHRVRCLLTTRSYTTYL